MKYFTVGPSQLYPGVDKYMAQAVEEGICSISHRSREFEDIFSSTVASLKSLLGIPQGHYVFFVGSATEAMERIVQDCSSKHTYHFVNGSFSRRFFKTAAEFGREAEMVEVPEGQGFESLSVPKIAEMACITQTETSTGVSVSPHQISSIKKQNPDTLVAVDIVSSVPYADLDYSLADLAFFSVQKGFGLPAGLGVIIASPAAFAKARAVGFHSFSSMHKKAQKNQTPETPNVLGIYLLGRVCTVMDIATVRKETEEKAKTLYNYLDEKGIAAVGPEYRSNTIIVANVADSKAVISELHGMGFAVSSGYGPNKQRQIRIANYPAHSLQDIKSLITSFEAIHL